MTTISIKKSAVPGKVPLVTDLSYGELALNYADGILYYKSSANQIQSISGGVSVTSLIAGTDTAISNSTGAVTIWNTGTLQSVTGRGSSTTNSLSILNNTNSTSTNSGALIVSGGVGVGGGIYAGGTVTATQFVGNLTGTATTAQQVQTQAQTANASYYPAFVSANNASPTAMSVYTTNSLIINPGTGNLGLGVTPTPGQNFAPVFQIGRTILNNGVNDRMMLAYNYARVGGVDQYIANDYATYYTQISGQHRWYSAPSGTAGNTPTFTQAMMLFNSGGLSIGNTTDPGATNLSVTGTIASANTVTGTQLISNVATGTAPLSVTSTTVVGNLNVSQLLGATWASPAAIGSTTPAAGTFTALSATSNAVGSVTAATGGLTAVTAVTGSLTLATGGVTLASQVMASGSVWRVVAYGTYAASSSANARTLTMACYWGSSALTSVTTGNVLASTAQTTPWRVEMEISGSSATAAWCTSVLSAQVTSATIPLNYVGTPTSVTGLTTTSTLDFRVGQTGTATSGDTINVHSVTIERIK